MREFRPPSVAIDLQADYARRRDERRAACCIFNNRICQAACRRPELLL